MARRLVIGWFAVTFAWVACGGGGDGGGQVTPGDVPDATASDVSGTDLPGQEIVQPDPGPPPTDPGSGDTPGSPDVPSQPDPGGPGDVLVPPDTPSPDIPTQPDGLPPQDIPVEPDTPVQPDIPTGNGTCLDIKACLAENECDTQACFDSCVATGNAQAQDQFLDLVQCTLQKCGQYGQKQPAQASYCIYTQCKAENLPCTQTGNLGCMGMLQCSQACGNPASASCVQGCVDQGTYEGQTALLAMLACVEEKCPKATQQCIIQNCMQPLMACQSS